MPRILRIINRLNLGGPTYNAVYLTKCLSPGYETLLLAGMKDETEASSAFIAEQTGVSFQYLPFMHRNINPLNDWMTYQKIKEIINHFKPHIVHTHAAKAGALGRLAAMTCKVPVIVHTFHGNVFHSYFNPVKTRIFIEIEKYLARKSTAIIAISEKQNLEIKSILKIPSQKIHTIPLGFDLQRFRLNQEEKRKTFRSRFMLDENEIAIGVVGRMVPIKNLEFFMEVVSSLCTETKKQFRVFLIGDGESRERIILRTKHLGISYTECKGGPCTGFKVVFTSWIKEIDEVMAGLDIVALCSLNEGTPVSLIEAQTAGKPVVSSKVGGVEDIIIDGKTGFLLPLNNKAMFIRHLKLLLENDELRRVFGNSAKNCIGERFNYLRLIKDTKDLYDNLLSEKTLQHS